MWSHLIHSSPMVTKTAFPKAWGSWMEFHPRDMVLCSSSPFQVPLLNLHPQMPQKRWQERKGTECLPFWSPSTQCPKWPHTAAYPIENFPLTIMKSVSFDFLPLLDSQRKESKTNRLG